MLRGPFWLDPNDESAPFPPVELALKDPNGLLALGGNLAPTRLIQAYCHGIFPWYNEGQPILWWSPDPRLVLFPQRLKVSRSLRKTLKSARYQVSLDRAFRDVVVSCAAPRVDDEGTWITADMVDAYCALHEHGVAHSVESWQDGELVGGLYGVALGRVFFGESMFARRSDASKVAFVHLSKQLQAWGYVVIDCQVQTRHLESLGAELIPRAQFTDLLERWCQPAPETSGPWHFMDELDLGITGNDSNRSE